MASSNIKLFDENKGNMLNDTEFNISTQRLNGLQTGVASSQLQNKAMYQASLVAYAIAQIMLQNGLNANDTDAVSAFVANLSSTMLQKVHDIATTEEAQAGVATGKWMSPALVKTAIDTLAAKAQNILSDETKALYGLGVNAVPNDVLSLLSRFQFGLGNEYLWEKALIQEVVKFGSSNDYQNSVYITPGNWPASVGLRTYYSSGLPEIVLHDGVYKFKFTDSIPMYGGCDTSILSGKWISTYRGGSLTTESWYIPDDGSLVWSGSNSNSNATCTITKGTLYKNPYYDVVKSSIEYVNSPDQNAYPPAVSDGYTYTALGKLGAKAQIATGIYAGTGTYGSSNPNSLTFEFEPGLVIISTNGRPSITFVSDWTQIALTKYFQTDFTVNRGFGYQIGNSGYGRKTNAGKTIEWYNTKNASNQMNNASETYYYIAIG